MRLEDTTERGVTAPWPVLALVLLTATADAGAADVGELRARILAGVGEIASPGSPGGIVPIDASAHALVHARLGDLSLPVVVVTEPGRGRVAALGHGGYLYRAGIEHGDTGRLLANLIDWTTRGVDPPARVRCRSGDDRLRELLGELGHDVVAALDGDAVDLEILDVEVADAGEQARLREYVAAGGGMIVVGLGWGWQQLNRGKDLAVDYRGNQLCRPLGFVWSNRQLDATSPERGLRVERSPGAATRFGTHAGDVLGRLEDGEAKWSRDESARGEQTLLAALAALPAADPLRERLWKLIDARLGESPPELTKPVKQPQLLRRLAVRLWHDSMLAGDGGTALAAPSATSFPGAVARDATTIERTVHVDASVPGWHGTGLYAAPGAMLTVTVLAPGDAAGLRLRIGCHSDRLWNKDVWRRWPQISRRWQLARESAALSSPHGGLVYVQVDRRRSRGAKSEEPIGVRIAGAVPAARFVRGKTAREDWQRQRDEAVAPWAELESDKISFSLPIDAVRGLEDPDAVMAYWDAVVTACEQLGGRPLAARPERFVADRQISAGYMHSGYPIMAHLDAAPRVVDLETLKKKGAWGPFHELGHNSQHRDWTFGGTTEVTCNLFTLYAMEKVVGIPTHEHPRVVGSRDRALAYIAGAESFDTWKQQPFLALYMYAQIQAAFGWQAFEDVFREYLTLKKRERPQSDDAKRDQWLIRLSRTVGHDLGPFFELWKVPVSARARKAVADLPVWLPEELR